VPSVALAKPYPRAQCPVRARAPAYIICIAYGNKSPRAGREISVGVVVRFLGIRLIFRWFSSASRERGAGHPTAAGGQSMRAADAAAAAVVASCRRPQYKVLIIVKYGIIIR